MDIRKRFTIADTQITLYDALGQVMNPIAVLDYQIFGISLIYSSIRNQQKLLIYYQNYN